LKINLLEFFDVSRFNGIQVTAHVDWEPKNLNYIMDLEDLIVRLRSNSDETLDDMRRMISRTEAMLHRIIELVKIISGLQSNSIRNPGRDSRL
jgi:Zn-dependent oligopeptidase